jgi:hypothetical protein
MFPFCFKALFSTKDRTLSTLTLQLLSANVRFTVCIQFVVMILQMEIVRRTQLSIR